MSKPKLYSNLDVWKALHFGENTSGWVKYEDYARLKAEVERLKAEPDALTAYLYADTLRRDDIKTLKAHIERLTKAGDELHAFLINYIVESRISSAYLNKLDDDWNAAKEGKQS
jgi:hypothetical protein